MKKTVINRLLCGILAAATVFTVTPAVSRPSSITAFAKTKTTTVKAGNFFKKDKGIPVCKNYFADWYGGFIDIKNKKKSAQYWFTTNSKNLILKAYSGNEMDESKSYNNWHTGDYEEGCYITAKKAGSYKVYVKEKYKGKTRTIKTLTMYVFEPKLVKKITAYKAEDRDDIDAEIVVDDCFAGSNYRRDLCYNLRDMFKFNTAKLAKYCYADYIPKKTGTTEFTVYDSFNKKIGTVKVVIKNKK